MILSVTFFKLSLEVAKFLSKIVSKAMSSPVEILHSH